jgi:hypothetical protein
MQQATRFLSVSSCTQWLPTPSHRAIRVGVAVVLLQLVANSRARSENFISTRYQYYKEDDSRVGVDSNYTMFSSDLSDTLAVDGSFLYSVISGASPTGVPSAEGSNYAPTVYFKDERIAFTLGVSKEIQDHSVKVGFALSDESDYQSRAYSIQDSYTFNQNNTTVSLGFSFTDDTVGANGSPL